MEEGQMNKRALVVLFVVMGLIAVSISAEAVNYTCTISQTGTNGANYYIVAQNVSTPAFNTTFYLSNSYATAREMYAAALTAFANATNVKISVSTTTPNSFVYSLGAVK
jgi:hypothetical protein